MPVEAEVIWLRLMDQVRREDAVIDRMPRRTMKGPAAVYRAEIQRAVLGVQANECKVADPERLNRIAEHLVDCEDAKAILRFKGYGAAGMTFVELAKSLPENMRGMLRELLGAQRHRDRALEARRSQ